MENIKHVAARTGYEIYLASGTTLTLDEINARLATVGLPGVKERSFKHYRNLARRGVLTYMPINDFDMAVKNGTLREAS